MRIKKPGAALGLIMAAALLARLAGLTFGLPHTETRPDETTVIYLALHFIFGGPEPSSLIYPTGYTYLLSFLYLIYAGAAHVLGHMASLATLLTDYTTNPQALFLINRMLGVVFGTAAVFAVYKTAEELWSQRCGLIAAAFMAFCPLFARDSHFGVLDVPMACMMIFSTLHMIRAAKYGKTADYLAAGIFAGLATGIKYAGILLPIPMLAAHMLSARPASENKVRQLLDKRLWLFFLVFGLTFFITTPYLFIDIGQTIADYNYHKTLHGVMHGQSWHKHLFFSLPVSMSLPLFLAALAGGALMLVRDTRKAVILLAFPVIYFLAIAKVNSVFLRYIIPLLPYLCVTAAYAVEEFTALKPLSARRTAAAAGLTLLLCAQPVVTTTLTDYYLSKKDSRVLAQEWVKANVRQGAAIAMLSSVYANPQVAWSPDYLRKYAAEAAAEGNDLKARMLKATADLRERRIETGYTKAEFIADKGFADFNGNALLPDCVIITNSEIEHNIPRGAAEALDKNYLLAAEFDAYDPSGRDQYDLTDAFFLPVAGFKGVRRPGPNVYIFMRKPV